MEGFETPEHELSSCGANLARNGGIEGNVTAAKLESAQFQFEIPASN